MKIHYTTGDYKYLLAIPYEIATPIKKAAAIDGFVRLTQDGLLRIEAGYAWDGASGPTIDTKSSMRASLVHDALYQLERHGHLGQEWRESADNLLHDICVADGMWSWRAKMWLWGVRKFAGYAAKQQAERIMVAP